MLDISTLANGAVANEAPCACGVVDCEDAQTTGLCCLQSRSACSRDGNFTIYSEKRENFTSDCDQEQFGWVDNESECEIAGLILGGSTGVRSVAAPLGDNLAENLFQDRPPCYLEFNSRFYHHNKPAHHGRKNQPYLRFYSSSNSTSTGTRSCWQQGTRVGKRWCLCKARIKLSV